VVEGIEMLIEQGARSFEIWTDLPAPVAALLGSATPLQLLTERIARARGTNPDAIRRDDPVYLAAADAAD